MTTGHRIKLDKAKTIGRDGKIKQKPTGDVSARIRQKKSKRVKVVMRSA